MAKTREFEAEVKVRREEAAAYLEALAAALRGGTVHVRMGRKSFTLKVPRRVELEVDLEKDGSGLELEIGLSWRGSYTGGAPKLSVGPAD